MVAKASSEQMKQDKGAKAGFLGEGECGARLSTKRQHVSKKEATVSINAPIFNLVVDLVRTALGWGPPFYVRNDCFKSGSSSDVPFVYRSKCAVTRCPRSLKYPRKFSFSWKLWNYPRHPAMVEGLL